MQKITRKSIFSNLLKLVFITLFVGVFSQIFGTNNSLTWVGIIVGIMLYWNLDIGINKKEAPIVILALFIFTGIANRIAEINPILGIFVNLISIFLIMYIPSEKPEYKAYIPFILIYIFDQSNIAVGEDFYTRMVSLVVGGIITGAVYYFRHKNSEEGIHISKIMKDIDITSPRFIISIRMAIGVSIAILIGTLLGLQRTMWISMSVMSLTQLEFETTKERFKHRIVYTLIGAVAFVLLFQVLIPEKYNGLASIILSYIYTFIKDYKHQIIFITVNALSASMLIFDPTEAIGTRILLIISGCMLAMAINKIDLKKPMIAIKERLAKPDIA